MDRKLFSHIRSARVLLILTVGLGLTGGFLAVAQAQFLARIVTQVFLRHASLVLVYPALLTLLGIIGLRALAAFGSEAAAGQVAAKVKMDVRERLLSHLAKLGPTYAKGEQSGEIALTIVDGVEALEPYLARYLPQVALSAFVPLTILAFVFWNDPLSGVILAVTAPLIPFFMILIGKGAQVISDRQWKALSLLSAHFVDVVQGLTTLKIFNRSRDQIEVIARISDDYRKATMASLRIAFLSALVLELLTTLSTAIVAVTIGLRLIAGDLPFSNAFFVLLLAPEFYLPIRLLGTQYHVGRDGVTAAKRIVEILETEPAVKGSSTATLRKPITLGRIAFEHVGYTYANAPQPTLRDISFQAEPMQMLAIVGASGAGKSTIADLLLGFIQPTVGRISIDDVDLRDVPLGWWREQVAWLPQQPHLFYGTIADNLRMANPACSDLEMIAAAKKAGADEFIRTFADGYQTFVGERGARLSGGQLQRIALARAFLKESEILLLDEPTSALDAETEWVIQGALRQLRQNRTVIVIAHRIHTIERADHILVMHEGTIQQAGKHRELLREPGLYRELVLAYSKTAGEGA
ncbi:thiol reductant ABC exporter subunit CydD [Sulfoacidibacillus thermotolerans]|nr:thiol reductant ABC exporter subunit CydD [Sulfoacidibacillus thermotolerans]